MASGCIEAAANVCCAGESLFTRTAVACLKRASSQWAQGQAAEPHQQRNPDFDRKAIRDRKADKPEVAYGLKANGSREALAGWEP